MVSLILPNLRRGRDEKLPLLSQFHFTDKNCCWQTKSGTREKQSKTLYISDCFLVAPCQHVSDLAHLKLPTNVDVL